MTMGDLKDGNKTGVKITQLTVHQDKNSILTNSFSLSLKHYMYMHINTLNSLKT